MRKNICDLDSKIHLAFEISYLTLVSMMLIDSHAHLEMPEFRRDLEEVIQRAKHRVLNISLPLEQRKRIGIGLLRLPIHILQSTRSWVFIPTTQERSMRRPIPH